MCDEFGVARGGIPPAAAAGRPETDDIAGSERTVERDAMRQRLGCSLGGNHHNLIGLAGFAPVRSTREHVARVLVRRLEVDPAFKDAVVAPQAGPTSIAACPRHLWRQLDSLAADGVADLDDLSRRVRCVTVREARDSRTVAVGRGAVPAV